MRKLAVIVMTIFSCVACNREDEQPEFEMTGTWTLTAVEYAWVDSTDFGDDIGFTESYVFERNGTFVKYSTRLPDSQNPDLPQQATGNYTLEASSNERFLYELELIFTSGSDLVSNCGDTNKELLQILPDKRLSNTGWTVCDGPGFLYQRVVD